MEQPRVVSPSFVRGLLLFCLALAAFYLWRLPGEWQAWRAGTPDFYPGQHRRQLLGSLGGLALVLAIPLPVVMGRTPMVQRTRRALLWMAWGALMAVVMTTLALGSVY